MAITVHATSSGGITRGSGTEAISLPSGMQENDIVRVFVFWLTEPSSTTVPSGWTSIHWDLGSSGETNTGILYKKMGATPDTSITLPQDDIGIGSDTFGGNYNISVLRGVDTTTPVDATFVGPTLTTDSSTNSASITTATANALVESIGYEVRGGTWTYTSGPSGYSNEENFAYTYAGSPQAASVAASKIVSTAGAEDPGSYTTNLTTGDTSLAFTLAWRPASTGGSGDTFSAPGIDVDTATASGSFSASGADNSGKRFVRRQNALRSSTANTTAADIGYDTAVFAEDLYTWSSPEVTVSEAGKYLTVFDLGQVQLASTRAVGTLVPAINNTQQERFRASHRYLRNSGGNHGASIGMAILDLAANDDIKVRNPGVLTPTDAVGNYATNAGAGGGFQMIKLPDGNFTHVERTVDAAEVGTSNINATRPWLDSSGTWTTITFNSEVNDDDSLYPGSGGDLTLAANKKYMVVWGVTAYSTDASRHTYASRLQIGGVNVQSASGNQRNTAAQGPPMCGMYLHETGGAAETLRLQATHEIEGGDAGTPNISDAYLQVIELPDSAEWIHVDNGTTDSLTTALAGTTTWYDTPLSSTFRADGDSNLSLDAANNAVQNDSGASMPVLAIGWHRWDRDSGTSGTRKMPWTRWDNGGSAVGYGVAGAYSRGQQSADDCWQAHYTSVATMDLANGADLSFQVNDPASGSNADMGVYASTSRYFLGVQVLNLDSLVNSGGAGDKFGGDGVDVDTTVGSATIAQDHKFAGRGITSEAAIDTAAIGQNHKFSSSGMEADTTIGAGSFSEIHKFSADGLEQDNTVGTASISQDHKFTGQLIEVDTEIGSASIAQTHKFGGVGVQIEPTIAAGNFGGVSTVDSFEGVGLDIDSDIGQATIAQDHKFGASGLSADSEVGAGSFSQEANFSAPGIESETSLGAASIGQVHKFSADGIGNDNTVGAAQTNQSGGFTAGGIENGNTVGSADITQVHKFSALGISTDTTIGLGEFSGGEVVEESTGGGGGSTSKSGRDRSGKKKKDSSYLDALNEQRMREIRAEIEALEQKRDELPRQQKQPPKRRIRRITRLEKQAKGILEEGFVPSPALIEEISEARKQEYDFERHFLLLLAIIAEREEEEAELLLLLAA